MGDHEDSGKPDGLMLNGLRPSEAATVTEVLDPERWAIAEERIKELITRIQPNKPSEERRLAVANYVTQLIMKCFPCQVFTFGSVPLKTYLPDGDIDLSTFSKNPDLKDTWANEVREILENEEKSEAAEFRVKEVQYIKAEVKIIKCLVENIVVDISFNQLGGLCTLCFLEEIDHLISQDHLFKRSIILIKAWCYYESRILGAHHGLLSTYALETLVLYIFHVFNNSFAGPLEVLYRFLEFFSKFDWEKFCVSLWGPVSISSLPDTTAEPPRKDSGELLLSQIFLNACSTVYTYLPSGLDNQGQPFGSKYLNVIDPLRTNNNLGRSVSKGNFYRIRSAFSFGAKKLSVLLECPKEDLVAEVDKFFLNTWRRHGTGIRPDAPADIPLLLQPPNSDSNQAMNNYKNQANATKKMENTVTQPGHHVSTYVPTPFVDLSGQSVVAGDHISQSIRTNGQSGLQIQKSFGRQVVYRVADQFARSVSSSENVQTEKLQSNSKPSNVSNDCTGQGKLQFARTHSSPELSETSAEILSRSRRNKMPDILKNHIISANPDVNHRKSFGSDVYVVQNARLDNASSPRYLSSHQNHRTIVDSNRMHNNFRESTSFSSTGEEPASVSQALEMNQEEQDMVNRMASPGINGLVQPIQLPVNFTSQFPVSSHFLPPFGYVQKNIVIPANMPIPPWGAQFPQGFMPHLSGYYPSSQLETNTEEAAESSNDVSSATELNQEDADHGSWLEQEHVPVGFVPPDRSFQIFNEKKLPSFGGLNFMPTAHVSNNVPFMRDPSGNTGENINMERVGHNETIVLQNAVESDMYSTNRCADTRFSTASQASSSRNMVTDSWDGPPIKASKIPRDRGWKPSSAVSSASHGSSKSWRRQNDSSVDHVPVVRDDDIGERMKQSSLGIEIAEQSSDSLSPVSASHHPSRSEPTLMSGSDSVFPIPPMIVCPNPRQRSGSGSNSYFYATGPPVPFYIVGCKYPSDSGASDGMVEQLNGVDANRSNSLFRDLDSSEKSEQSEVSVSTNLMDDVPLESFEVRKPDILHSDFSSHWQNLQYGRLCQDTSVPGPPIYPAPLMVPPVYFQGHHHWDGPGRPFPAPANVLPIVNYPRFVQVLPMQPGSVRHTEVYQRYGDELPSYRGGTGTFLPKAKVPFRERTSSSRNHRPSYGYDHEDREGSWISSKARVSGRSRGRGQHDKPSTRLDRLPSSDNRNDRSWDSHKNDRLVSDVSNHQNNSISSTNPGHANITYDMYPFSSMNSDNTHPSGAAVPSFVMLYPCPNLGYGSSSEPVEYGSVVPMHLSSINEVHPPSNGVLRSTFDPRLESYQQNSACSSPDQPSSPRRRI